jgi:hypothetical protein
MIRSNSFISCNIKIKTKYTEKEQSHLFTLLQKGKLVENTSEIMAVSQNITTAKSKCSIHQICHRLIISTTLFELDFQHSVVSLIGNSVFPRCGNRLRGALSDALVFFPRRPSGGGRYLIFSFLASVPAEFFETVGQRLYYMTLIREKETHGSRQA